MSLTPRQKAVRWLFGVLLSELFPVLIIGVICLFHRIPFPLDDFVHFSFVVIIAGSVFILTLFDLWIEGMRLNDYPPATVVVGVIVGSFLFLAIVLGVHVDFLVQQNQMNDAPAIGWWFFLQTATAVIAIGFCVYLKLGYWTKEDQKENNA